MSAGSGKRYPTKGRNYNTTIRPGTKACKTYNSGTYVTGGPHPEWKHNIILCILPFYHQQGFLSCRDLVQPKENGVCKKCLKGEVSTKLPPLTSQVVALLVGQDCNDDAVNIPMDIPTDHPTVPLQQGSAHSAAGAHHIPQATGSISLGLAAGSPNRPRHMAEGHLTQHIILPESTRHLYW